MDNVMSRETTFSYKYSAKENEEIQEIRKKYLPKNESKMDEVKRLDAQVQNAGVVAALCIGIISSLILGLGMSMAMQVLGSGMSVMLLGILIGIIGMAGMFLAYPVYRAQQRRTKEKLSPRILELIDTFAMND